MPTQNLQPAPSSNLVRPPLFIRNHPYSELIEKLVSMGYRGDYVVCVIQKLEESGEPVDFNAVPDRLNGHSSGGPQRGWSGSPQLDKGWIVGNRFTNQLGTLSLTL
ncbi:hypothetical protein ACH5RR_037171, partial [Cinchona calisaya]